MIIKDKIASTICGGNIEIILKKECPVMSCEKLLEFKKNIITSGTDNFLDSFYEFHNECFKIHYIYAYADDGYTNANDDLFLFLFDDCINFIKNKKEFLVSLKKDILYYNSLLSDVLDKLHRLGVRDAQEKREFEYFLMTHSTGLEKCSNEFQGLYRDVFLETTADKLNKKKQDIEKKKEKKEKKIKEEEKQKKIKEEKEKKQQQELVKKQKQSEQENHKRKLEIEAQKHQKELDKEKLVLEQEKIKKQQQEEEHKRKKELEAQKHQQELALKEQEHIRKLQEKAQNEEIEQKRLEAEHQRELEKRQIELELKKLEVEKAKHESQTAAILQQNISKTPPNNSEGKT